MAKLVSELMSTDLIQVGPEEDLSVVYDLMAARGVRHILVVDAEGDLLGLLSQRDMIPSSFLSATKPSSAQERDVLRSIKVSEVYTRDPETVEADTPLIEAGQILLENKFGCLPVVSGSRPVGILTEADFVKLLTRADSPKADRTSGLGTFFL